MENENDSLLDQGCVCVCGERNEKTQRQSVIACQIKRLGSSSLLRNYPPLLLPAAASSLHITRTGHIAFVSFMPPSVLVDTSLTLVDEIVVVDEVSE